MAEVAIIIGSKSDLETMEKSIPYYEYFKITYELKIMSAHRNPEEVMNFSKNACQNGYKLIVAGAGLAAHLGGVIASHTTLPVIGVPMTGGVMGGLDALLSMVQMPSGVPVPTMTIGSHGAKNAAILCAQILALSDSDMQKRLEKFKKEGNRL